MRAGHLLVGASLLAAVGDWGAVALRARRAEYVLKPLTLGVLVAGAVVLGPGDHPVRWSLTLAALALSLAGDVFLMLPSDRFLPGLTAFLLAHLAYAGAFNTAPAPILPTVAAAAVVATTAAIFVGRLRTGMARGGQARMLVPTSLYAVAIGAMVVSAAVAPWREGWSPAAGIVAAAGAILFAISDGLIGWRRFVSVPGWAPVVVMVTYHLGQVGLVLGLLGLD